MNTSRWDYTQEPDIQDYLWPLQLAQERWKTRRNEPVDPYAPIPTAMGGQGQQLSSLPDEAFMPGNQGEGRPDPFLRPANTRVAPVPQQGGPPSQQWENMKGSFTLPADLVNPLAGTRRGEEMMRKMPQYFQGEGATLAAQAQLRGNEPGVDPTESMRGEAADIRRRLEAITEGYPHVPGSIEENRWISNLPEQEPAVESDPHTALDLSGMGSLAKGALIGGAGLAATAGGYGIKKAMPYLSMLKSGVQMALPQIEEKISKRVGSRLLEGQLAAERSAAAPSGPGIGEQLRGAASSVGETARDLGANLKEGISRAGSNIGETIGGGIERFNKRFEPADASELKQAFTDMVMQHIRNSYQPGQEKGQEVTKNLLNQMREMAAPFLEPIQAPGSKAAKEAAAWTNSAATRGWTGAGKPTQELYSAAKGTTPQGGTTMEEGVAALRKAKGKDYVGPRPFREDSRWALTPEELERVQRNVVRPYIAPREGLGVMAEQVRKAGGEKSPAAELMQLIWRLQENPQATKAFEKLMGYGKGLGLM